MHWTWVIAAVFFLQLSQQSPFVFLAEYVGLFLIVLTHEFGHALACRSVKGTAEHIVLFPLGGVAYVNPPHRPGAVLWSVVAGPLVNVVLVPVLFGVWMLLVNTYNLGPGDAIPLPMQVVYHLMFVNGILLVFNMMPIYPLDGGQIVQAILWYFVGYRKSLQFVATIGMAAAVVVIALGLFKWQDFWMVIIAIFVFMQALKGYAHARLLAFGEQMQEGMNDMFNQAGFDQTQQPSAEHKPPRDEEVFDPKTYEKKQYMDD